MNFIYYGPLNKKYLNKLIHITRNALNEHARTLAIRVDLRFSPDWFSDDSIRCYPDLSEGMMSRFMSSLKAQIKAYRKRQSGMYQRVHPCTPRYFWVKETSGENYSHFHLVLFFNKDLFRAAGVYQREKEGIGGMIAKAWLSALNLKEERHYTSLTHFPDNSVYLLDRNHTEFDRQYDAFLSRASYLTKESTKVYSPLQRSMGGSQR